MIALLIAGTSTVCAGVRVQGDAAALRIDADKSQLSEVLAALGPRLNVRVQTSSPLDRVISGTYKGSLRDVLSRMLENYNYIVETRGNEVEVRVYGARGAPLPTAAPPGTMPANGRAAKRPGPARIGVPYIRQ